MARKKAEVSEELEPKAKHYLAPIESVVVDEGFNVRHEPSPEPGQGLLDSISARGVDVSLIVRKKKGSDKLFLVDGHRRYAAALKVGITHVPVADYGVMDTLSAIGVAVSANNSRKSMSDVDLVSVCRRLVKLGVTIRDAASKLGMTASTVGNYYRLANCDKDIRDAVKEGKVSKRAALSSVRVKRVKGRIEEPVEPEAAPVVVTPTVAVDPPPVPQAQPTPVLGRPRVSRVPGEIPGSRQNLSVVMPGESLEREYRLVSDWRERCQSMENEVRTRLRQTPSNKKLLGMELVIGVLRGRLSVEQAFIDWEKK
jgi:ParB/RepB/Spo0J family partition protein